MSRAPKIASPPRPRAVQTELFPEPLVIDALDPRAIAGARTRVAEVYLVRERPAAPAHRIFHDRHGWYCEEHGARCTVLGGVRAALGATG